jgi:hypothetical protein
MISRRKETIKRLFEELPELDLITKEDNEAREAILDQLGVSISSGGRGILLVSLMAVIGVPKVFRTVPRSLLRFPMIAGICYYIEDLYYLGAEIMLLKKSKSFLSQMKTMQDGSQLKKYAESFEL